jgi:predicted NBD/HSP70 family sugar kinase
MPPAKELLLGIEIGGTKLQLVAAETPRNIVRRDRLTVEPGANAVTIQESIEVALAAWPEIKWKSAGVGFGGPVDRKLGRVFCSHQVSGWDGVDLGGWLTAYIGAPVAIENDTNLAALAEVRQGAEVGCSPVFLYKLRQRGRRRLGHRETNLSWGSAWGGGNWAFAPDALRADHRRVLLWLGGGSQSA